MIRLLAVSAVLLTPAAAAAQMLQPLPPLQTWGAPATPTTSTAYDWRTGSRYNHDRPAGWVIDDARHEREHWHHVAVSDRRERQSAGDRR
jgi:hypothetical protein